MTFQLKKITTNTLSTPNCLGHAVVCFKMLLFNTLVLRLAGVIQTWHFSQLLINVAGGLGTLRGPSRL